MERQITLEQMALPANEAKEYLDKKMARGWHWRIAKPCDFTPDDLERYAADCVACGVVNYYA